MGYNINDKCELIYHSTVNGKFEFVFCRATVESATSLMRIYLFVAQWIGCLPFRLDFQTFKPSSSTVRSSLCLIIPCLLLFIEVYVTEFLWNDTLNYDVAIQFFRKTSFFVHYSTCLLIFFTAFFKRKLHMIAVEKLISFAKRYHLAYEFSKGSTRNIMILVFLMLMPQVMPFFKLFYDIFDIIMGNSGTIFNVMFFPVSYIYTIPIICFLCLCFYFERLNAALEKVKYTNKTNSHFVGLRIAYSELFDILQKLNESLDLQLSLLYIHLFSRYIVVSFDFIYSVFVDKSRTLAYNDVTRQSFFLLKFYTLSQAGDMLASEVWKFS